MAKANTIENFPTRFKEKLEAFLQANPLLVDAQGKPGGYYSLDIHDVAVRARLTPFGRGGPKLFHVTIGTRSPTNDNADFVIDSAALVCNERGFFPIPELGHPHNRQSMRKEVESAAIRIMRGDSEFSASPPLQKGLFSTTQQLISDEHSGHQITINIRPYTDIARSLHTYLKIPHEIRISAGSRNVEELKRLRSDAEEMLLEMGFQKGAITPALKETDTKIIPKDWIDISRMEVIKLKRMPNYYLLVPESRKQRFPRFKVSTGVTIEEGGAEWAERAKIALCNEYLSPRLQPGNDEPITPTAIRAWLSGWLEKNDYSKQHKTRRESASRQMLPVSNVAGKSKCVLYTPYLREGSAALCFVPCEEGEKPRRIQGSIFNFPVNTNDATLAEFRKHLINRIAVATLNDYFSRYPEAKFATEPRMMQYSGNLTTFFMIRPNPAPSYAFAPTLTELNSLLGDPNNKQSPNTSTLSHALSVAINRAELNEAHDEELGASLKRALQSEAGEKLDDVPSQLDIAMLSGVKDFLHRRPEYRIWKGTNDEVLGVEVDRAMNIDADYLTNNILRPAIDRFNNFPRMMAWDMHAEPADQEHQDGAQIIKVRAIKNPLVTSEPADPPWDKDFALHADSAENARECIEVVNNHFYNDPLTGRPRPVEHFGSPSQGLVFRESLGAGLRTQGITIPDDCPVANALEQLQRGASAARVRT